LVLKV
jgi:hypothetical protein